MSQFELKAGDNFIFAIDVSGSMATTDCPNGMNRLEFAEEKMRQFCKEADKIDADGISVITFGHAIKSWQNIHNDAVEKIIDEIKPNQAATLTDRAITAAYQEHVKNGNSRTLLLIVTDGEPTSEPDVFKAVADITKAVKNEQEFRICFLTVGEISAGLSVFLQHLDDKVPGSLFDIVEVLDLNETCFYGAVGDTLAA